MTQEENRQRNDNHGHNIWSDGRVTDSETGEELGNLHDYD
jgi:hypothetical protein